MVFWGDWKEWTFTMIVELTGPRIISILFKNGDYGMMLGPHVNWFNPIHTRLSREITKVSAFSILAIFPIMTHVFVFYINEHFFPWPLSCGITLFNTNKRIPIERHSSVQQVHLSVITNSTLVGWLFLIEDLLEKCVIYHTYKVCFSCFWQCVLGPPRLA